MLHIFKIGSKGNKLILRVSVVCAQRRKKITGELCFDGGEQFFLMGGMATFELNWGGRNVNCHALPPIPPIRGTPATITTTTATTISATYLELGYGLPPLLNKFLAVPAEPESVFLVELHEYFRFYFTSFSWFLDRRVGGLYETNINYW